MIPVIAKMDKMTVFKFSSGCRQIAINCVAACALFITFSGTINAQNSDSKRGLAVRAVAAQEGPEMDRMLSQLAGSATQPLVARWNERIGKLAKSKHDIAITAVEAELKRFNADALQIITAQATLARSEALVVAYLDRFSEDELQQLVSLMEAPVFKKYQAIAPELGSVYFRAIIEGTRSRIQERSQEFDAAAEKIVGPAPKVAVVPAKKSSAASAKP